MAKHMASREWVRDSLEKRGYSQRDLAKAWGASEASASRFLTEMNSGDLSISRAYALSRMLDMDLEELAKRLGVAGAAAILPPPSVPARNAPPIGTFEIKPVEGRIRALIHLDLAPEAAGELMQFMARVSQTISSPPPSAPPSSPSLKR